MSAIVFPFVNFARYSSSVASSFLDSIHKPLTSTPAQRRAAVEAEEPSPIKVPRRSTSTTSLNTEAVFASGVVAREQPKEVPFDSSVAEDVVSEQSSALVKTRQDSLGVGSESGDMHQRGWYEPVAVQHQKEGKGKAPIRDWEAGNPAYDPSDLPGAVITIPSDTDSIPSKRRRGFTGRLLRLPFTILLSVWNALFRLTYGNLAIRAPDLEEGRHVAAIAYTIPVTPHINTSVGDDSARLAAEQQPIQVEKRTELVPGSSLDDEMSPVDAAVNDVSFPAVPKSDTAAVPAVTAPVAIAITADGSEEVISEKSKSKVTEVQSESPVASTENIVKIGEIRSRTPSILDEPVESVNNSPAIPAAPEVPATVQDDKCEEEENSQVALEGYLSTVEEEDEEDLASVGRGVFKKPAPLVPEELKVVEEEKPVVAESPEAVQPVTETVSEQVPVVEVAPVTPAPTEPAQPEAVAEPAPEPVKSVPEVAAPVVEAEEKKEEVAIIEVEAEPEVEVTPVPAIEAASKVETPTEAPAKIEVEEEETPAKISVDTVPEKVEVAPAVTPAAEPEKPVEKKVEAEPEPVHISKQKRRMSWLPKKDEDASAGTEEKSAVPQRSWTVRRTSTSAAAVKSKMSWKPTKKDTKNTEVPAEAESIKTESTQPSGSTETIQTVTTNPAAAPEPHFEKPNLMKRMSWTPGKSSKDPRNPINQEKRSSWASSFKLGDEKKKERKQSADNVSIASSTMEKKKTLGSMFRRSTTTSSIPTTAASSVNNLLHNPPAVNNSELPPTPPRSTSGTATPPLLRSTSALSKPSGDAEVGVVVNAVDEAKKKKTESRKKWTNAGKAINAFKLGKK